MDTIKSFLLWVRQGWGNFLPCWLHKEERNSIPPNNGLEALLDLSWLNYKGSQPPSDVLVNTLGIILVEEKACSYAGTGLSAHTDLSWLPLAVRTRLHRWKITGVRRR